MLVQQQQRHEREEDKSKMILEAQEGGQGPEWEGEQFAGAAAAAAEREGGA